MRPRIEPMRGQTRRYYRLTPEGAVVLAEEASRLRANAAAALRRLNPGLARRCGMGRASRGHRMSRQDRLERGYRRVLA
jgi:DNA-binding PadR family transcriptional regulator